MLSWVFRHRARLGVIYGLTAREPGLGASGAQPSDGEPRAPHPAEEPAGDCGEPVQAGGEVKPGHWARRARYVLLRPMRPGQG